jgi:HPt (histidine-containing phosphotransfer) domain-containing protein
MHHTIKPYDLSLLGELQDRQQQQDIISLFLANTPLQLQELLADAEKQDWQRVSGHAHKLISSAGVIQANGFLTLLKAIEDQAKARAPMDPAAMDSLLRELIKTYSEIESLLKKELIN